MVDQTPSEITIALLSNGWSYPTIYTKIPSPNRKMLVIRGIRCPISPSDTAQVLPFEDSDPASSTIPSDSFFIQRQNVREFFDSSHTSLNEELASQTTYGVLSYLHSFPPTYNLGNDLAHLPDVVALLKTSNGEFVARHRWSPQVFALEDELVAIYSSECNLNHQEHLNAGIDLRFSIGPPPVCLNELVAVYPSQRLYTPVNENSNNHAGNKNINTTSPEQQPVDRFVGKTWLGRGKIGMVPKDVGAMRPGRDEGNDSIQVYDGIVFHIPRRPKLPEGKAEGEAYIMFVVSLFGLIGVISFCWWVLLYN